MTNQTPQTNKSEGQQQPLDLSRAKMILRVWAEANPPVNVERLILKPDSNTTDTLVSW